MHSYLKSIGFERIKCQSDVEQLLLFVVKHTQEEYRAELNEDILYGEFVLEVAEGIGIVVCGEYDKSGHFSVVHYFPYCKGRQISTDELVYVHKRVETNAFSAMCDDYRFGISLIFYLQNAVDYLKQKEKRKREPYTIYLSGLARDGKILLPTLKTEKQLAEKLTENIQ